MRPYLMIKRSQLGSFESDDAVHHSGAAIILRNRHVGQPDSWEDDTEQATVPSLLLRLPLLLAGRRVPHAPPVRGEIFYARAVTLT